MSGGERPTWKALLARGEPLLLPCAHDALSARLIERAGLRGLCDRRLRAGRRALRAARHRPGRLRRDERRHARHHGGDRACRCWSTPTTATATSRTSPAPSAGYEAMGVGGDLHRGPGRAEALRPHGRQDVIDADGDGGEDPRRGGGAAQRRLSSSWRAPMRARCTASTRRCAAPSSTSRPAPTACSSRRRRPSRSCAQVGRAFQGVPQLANMVEGGGQHAGAAAGRALPPRLRHGRLSDHAAVPRRPHHRERRWPTSRPAGSRSENDGVDFADFQGHHRLRATGRRSRNAERPRKPDAEDDHAWLASSRRDRRCVLVAALPASAGRKPEPKVRLAVGGKPALFYLPLTVTERLGYFRERASRSRFPISPAARGRCRRWSAAAPTS